MNKSEIFKAAHKLAKMFTGNYSACFSMALKIVYKESKMEEMTGTEKQVEWAKALKKTLETKINEYLSEYNEPDEIAAMLGFTKKEIDNEYNKLIKFRDAVSEKKSAKWFIDNRNQPMSVMLQNEALWK